MPDTAIVREIPLDDAPDPPKLPPMLANQKQTFLSSKRSLATLLVALVCSTPMRATDLVPLLSIQLVRGNLISLQFPTSPDVPYVVECSANLQMWMTLAAAPVVGPGGIATVTDQVGANPARFYRLRLTAKSGIYSFNVVGYVAIPIVPGATLLAKPLLGHDPLLTTALPVVPDSSVFYKVGSSGAEVSFYDSFLAPCWINESGDTSTTTLAPGEGGLFLSETSTRLMFVGEVPQGTLVNYLPAGLSLCSSIVPQAGRIAADLGLVPDFGDIIYRWNVANQVYHGFMYDPDFMAWIDLDSWDWVGEPVMGLGEAFWVKTAFPKTWTRPFSVDVSGSSGPASYAVTNLPFLGPANGFAPEDGPTPTLAITSQPQSLSEMPGGTAGFAVAATSSTPLSYQWRKNGTNLVNDARLSGVTTTNLTIVNVQADDAGSYTVAVSDSSQTLTSSAATLTVFLPLTIVSGPIKKDHTVSLRFSSQPGTYYLEFKNELTDGLWTPAATNVATDNETPISDPAATVPHRFYRIRQR